MNLGDTGVFEGYYNNPEADWERTRGANQYWTGDLGYRDEAGIFWFAGRQGDWLRVDGENFAGAPVEAILGRFPGCVVVAVYAVPDVQGGDAVMAALVLRDGPSSFDPTAFAAFLAEQRDLGTKWAPTFVRVAASLASTATQKVVQRDLQAQRWDCADPVWWRPTRSEPFRLLDDAGRDGLRAALAARDRSRLLS